MMKGNSGFSLIELLITIVILGMVLAGVSQIFSGIFMGYRQQSSIAETTIEGNLGLELLRQDLASAGYGIPWVIPPGVVNVGYNEAAGAGEAYNDAPSNAPRAIVNGDGSGIYIAASDAASDELIIKSVSIARNDASKRWSYIRSDPAVSVKTWDVASENPQADDHIMAISPGNTDATRRTLVTISTNSAVWRTTFGALAGFAPLAKSYDSHFLYTLSSTTVPRMPFNRADYYISTSNVPQRCAPNTGVLEKSVINQGDGSRDLPMPLLDCVADFQVIFLLLSDTNGDGVVDDKDGITTAAAHGLNAQDLRARLKEVRVYVLAQEGERDRSYVHGASDIYVGDPSLGGGHTVNITGDAKHYRWKVYTIAVKPLNLR